MILRRFYSTSKRSLLLRSLPRRSMTYFQRDIQPLIISPTSGRNFTKHAQRGAGLTYLREIVYDCYKICPKIRTNNDDVGAGLSKVRKWEVAENICRTEHKITGIALSKNEIISRSWSDSVVHPLHRRPRGDLEEFTGSCVANGGGGRAAMLGPPRDRLPYSPGCALYPLSCPSVSYNAGTSGTTSSCYTLPAIESSPYFSH